ncbi:sigma-70 family RNA polymerase sigma factor [Dokdonia sinensis]|uniref:Sigma-70 family RNA polymerase sigma factor n=1 Tax=Dokdonia sinensis TaxID=2479847 RepID=A0A3M0H2L0_9FLAO|nr:sigma-70 family RNA polymerase sigma factor [Dokdonia sinensis]RMB63886.1 sigma-70 family RNA polymerase sigma factor [Dokdonia sinensis]
MEITPDKILSEINKAKEGKQSAFSFLLNVYWNEVYGFQLKRTQNEYEAEDITIQSFSKAFDKIQTYKEEFQFNTWLIAISKNIHIDILRKKSSSVRSQTDIKDKDRVYKVPDENLTAEDALIKEQNLAQLLNYIKMLKPHYQEMINLRYFQEMSYKEMATSLGEPMNNVKVKLLRARRLLADIINKVER